MNWQTSVGVFVAGILSIYLTSCKQNEPSELGVQLQQNQAGVIFVDTFQVNSTVFIDDTINSSNVSELISGKYSDPDFGAVEAKCYFQFLLPNGNFSFSNPDTVFFDKITLSFKPRYNYELNGDLKLRLKQLVAPVTDAEYKVKDTIQADSVLGSVILSASNIGDTVVLNIDSLFGQAIWDKSGMNELATQDNFESFIKGFVLEADSGSGVVGIDLNSSFNLNIHYRKIKNGVVDSYGQYSFPCNFDANRFNHISVNRTGTQISSLTQIGDSIVLPNQTVFQAGTGVKAKIEFPSLKQFLIENKENIVINKAEIDIKYESSTFNVPDYLFVFDIDSGVTTGGATILNDDNSFLSPNGTNQYTLKLTNYFQTLLTDPTNVKPIAIYPTSNAQSVNRAVVDSIDQNIKLKIYYTQF